MRLSIGLSKTLFDRLGGIYPIAAVVDAFSDALISNSVVGKDSLNPALRDWHKNSLGRLPGLKWMRTLWVASVAGGPYPKPDLGKAHHRFNISSDEFDEVARVLKSTMIDFDIPAREQGEVMNVFLSHKKHVTRR